MDISVPVVGFIFVCIIFPKVVKNKPQFYMGFAVLLIILILGILIEFNPEVRFFRALRGVLWIVDFIVLVLATGGLSLHELGGELKGAYEVMRRGEETKTVIVPLTGEQPRNRDDVAAARAAQARRDEGPRSIPLD